MYFYFKHNATGWIHWNYTGITLKSHWMGYTGITLKCHWMDTLKVHWNSTAPQMHLQAPQMHLQRTQMHLQRTTNAPPAHLKQCTSSAPQTVHLLAPQPHLRICTLHLQRTPTAPPSTSTAPPSTTTFTNPCLAIKSGVHLSAPQKCTPPWVRCAPPSTSAHRGMCLTNQIAPSRVKQIHVVVWPCLRLHKKDLRVSRSYRLYHAGLVFSTENT